LSEKAGEHPCVVVCIPSYNESKHIGEIIKKAKSYASEVIVCDDGSIDTTSQVAKSAGATVVRHPTNKGYGSAIKTLFQIAREKNADVMVTLDSDGQHDPHQIPDVIEPIFEGYDLVIGSRFLSEKDSTKVPSYRSFGIKTITRFAQLVSYNNMTDAQSGFRAYSKNALAKIDLVEDGMAVSTEILMRAGQKNLMVKEVPITITYDVEDASTHNPISHGLAVLTTIFRFLSLRHPLAFYGTPGISFLVIAGLFMSNALDLFSHTRYVSTNMILISVGTAVIGVVLIVTGVILSTISALLRDRIRSI
jgi:glycosyltransferase involved in cell wall biosynthesis